MGIRDLRFEISEPEAWARRDVGTAAGKNGSTGASGLLGKSADGGVGATEQGIADEGVGGTEQGIADGGVGATGEKRRRGRRRYFGRVHAELWRWRPDCRFEI